MESNRSDSRFEFVGNRVDEAVVLLAAAKLPHQKAGVHDHARDNQRKKNDAEEEQHSLPPVENNPSNVKGHRQRDQGDAQAQKENDSSAAARDAHGVTLILQCWRLGQWASPVWEPKL